MTILCGILFGALNVGFFLLGYYVRDKKTEDNGIVATENNREFIEFMNKWRNYNGR